MKKLPLPHYDDTEIITALAGNTRLNRTSYPYLRNELNLILDGYDRYMDNNGDAWSIYVDLLPSNLKAGVLTNYDDPPKELKYLDELRKSSQNVCPMCGSEKAVNLDHILTKEHHPQWAVFSKNLVPACKCNTDRGTVLTGEIGSRQRILHPYFDQCLSNRLLSCRITPDQQFRLADIELVYIHAGLPEHESIKFHTEKIVKPVLVLWLDSQWAQLRRNPCDLIQTIPTNLVQSVGDMRAHLNDAMTRFDRRTGSQNNWNSILIHGLLASDHVVEWLLAQHNGIISGDIDPEDN